VFRTEESKASEQGTVKVQCTGPTAVLMIYHIYVLKWNFYWRWWGNYDDG